MHWRDSEGDPKRNVAVGKEETLVLTLIKETKELGRGKMSGNSPARSNATGQTEAERFHSADVIFHKQSEQVKVIYNLQ